MPVENSKERSAKIKEHVDYFNSIREVGIIEACNQGIIKKVGVSVSGGKDSVATLLWAKNNLPKNIEIIGSYVGTPLENRDIKNYIKYISEETEIKIDIYEHTQDELKETMEKFLENSLKIGPPFTVRYCEGIIKESLYKKFNKDTDIQFVGIRWRESQARQNVTKLYRYAYNIFYHPILSWSKNDVFNYIKDNKIKLYHSYKYADRLGCSLCPLNMSKKKCELIYFVSKERDFIDFEFYEKWYSILDNYKFDRSGEAFVKRLNYLKSNWRKLKKLLENPHNENIKIEEYNPPVFEWYDAK